MTKTILTISALALCLAALFAHIANSIEVTPAPVAHVETDEEHVRALGQELANKFKGLVGVTVIYQGEEIHAQ